jgi:hypothetical protein
MPTRTITDDLNLNPQLSRQNYQFIMEKFRDLPFSIVAVNLPDVSLGSLQLPSPRLMFKEFGTSISYSDLSITYQLDEELTNYIEMFNWLHSFKGLQILSDEDQVATETALNYDPNNSTTSLKTDATLYVLSNKKNPKVAFQFKDCFPVSLSGVAFTTKDGANIVTCDLTLKFNNFTVKAVV